MARRVAGDRDLGVLEARAGYEGGALLAIKGSNALNRMAPGTNV
jgi:hypothetical protein